MVEKSRRGPAALLASLGVCGCMVLVACRTPTETVTVEVTRVVVETVVKTVDVAVEVPVEVEAPLLATVEVDSPKDLVVCMPHEPASLFPYASDSLVEQAVLHGLFENDFTTLSFGYQPQGVEKIPSIADGDAQIKPVEVREGDTIVDARGDVQTLKQGIRLVNSVGEEIIFDGSQATMNQMVVEFVMKPRVWSDGIPVTAEDSVYSFKLDSDPDIPAPKDKVVRTESYEATAELTLRWTGIPGFLDDTYFTNFWRPLPRHLWERFGAAELLEEELSSRLPVGDGPYRIASWVTHESIRLVPNEHYYRTDEHLPHLASVTFRFIPDPERLTDQLLAGACHIVTHEGLSVSQAPLLFEAEANGLLVPYFQTGTVYEQIYFGINSWGRFGDGDGRPDWFEDARVRRAMVMCIDRQAMVDDIYFGQSEVMHSYVPSSHPLYPDDLAEWPHDVTMANFLLDEAGYFDEDGDHVREDPITGKSFRVSLQMPSSYVVNLRIGQAIRNDLLDCGVDVELNVVPASEWLAPGSESPLFGRRFDMGQLALQVGERPACSFFTAAQITGPAGEMNRKSGTPYGGWNAVNATGWWDPEFDAACRSAMRALPGTAEYRESHMTAQRIFADQVPVIPLFPRVKVAAARPEVLNFDLDPTQPSELWNLFELDLQR